MDNKIRELATGIGKMKLNVPRTREGNLKTSYFATIIQENR